MFQFTKNKELEKQTHEKQALLKQYSRVYKEISEQNIKVQNGFQHIETEQKKIVECLDQVTESVKQVRENTVSQSWTQRKYIQAVREICDQLEQSVTDYDKMSDTIKAQENGVTAAVEESRHFKAAADKLGRVGVDMQQDILPLREGLNHMKDFGHQMGVLSLNAAIEAGRLGDSGRTFVGAAQEVMDYAIKYQQTAEMLLDSMDLIDKKLSENRAQTENVTGRMEEGSKKIESVAEMLTGLTKQLEQINPIIAAEGARDLLALVCETQPVESHAQLKEVLSSLEQAGASLTEQKQSVNDLRGAWQTVQEQTRAIKLASSEAGTEG